MRACAREACTLPGCLLSTASEGKSLKTGKLPHLVVKYGITDKCDEMNVHPALIVIGQP